MWTKRAWLCAIVSSLLFLTSAFAAEVSQDSARVVAQNWVHHLTKENRLANYASGTRQIVGEEVIFHQNTVVGYNFILSPSGHIIVPFRDELPPVKLYSDTTTLRMTDDSPVVEWIKEELYKLNEVLDAHSAEFATVDQRATHNGTLWSVYKSDAIPFSKVYDAASSASESLSLGPLLSTTWNQGAPYNNYTPLWSTGERTLTGCVATVAAQILKYWNYPATGQGSTSYSWWNGTTTTTLSRDFSTSTYNWSLMKNAHTTGDTSVEQDAVARLMSDVGVAFHMDYGPASLSGSGANTMYGVTVFPTYFKYANTISDVYRTNYATDSAWMQVFKYEVQNGRPSQLRLRDPAARGHSVVVDGYRDSPAEQIHINFGWSGSYDGWYVTNNIATGSYSWSDVNYQAAVIGITPGQPSITTFTAAPPSPQSSGTNITFTATAGGGTAPYQYKWWVGKDGVWTIGQDWGTSAAFAWTPVAPGTYAIQVWARSNGNTSDTPEAHQQLTYTVTGTALTVASLTPDKVSPQPIGTPITLTATATGGMAPYQYKWWVYNGSTWSIGQAWGTGNSYTWTPSAPGSYLIQVWARNAVTTTDTWEAYGQLAYTVTGTALTVTSVTASPVSPQLVGTPVTLTATATGGVAPYQYKWWVYNGSTWSVGQAWSTSNSFVWTPVAPGNYRIQVWARNAVTTTDTWEAYGQLAYTVTGTALTVTSVTASPVSPQLVGTPVTLTATATGGMAPYQYKWWVYNGSTWSIGQAWGTGNSYTWTPSAPGSYLIQVWARNAVTTTDTWEAYGQLAYTVTGTALTVTSVTASPVSPQLVGTPVTLTATASGGTAPYQYKWWIYNGSTWSVGQNWSTSNTFAWTPTVYGNYSIQVWVRSTMNTTETWEAYGTLRYQVASTLSVSGVTADKASPQLVGTPITFTATASGGTGPYQYKWWIEKDGAWTVGQTWSASPMFTWIPSSAGAYHLQVWARSADTPTDTPEAYRTLAYTVTPGLTVASVTPDRPSPQAPWTTITFTATATGGVAPYQYKWWVFNGSTWSVGQAWSPVNAFAWTPSGAGTYQLQVWVRNSGTTTDAPEAYGVLTYTIVMSLNLAPYQPAGWSDKIVVASSPGSFTDAGSYGVNATYYVSFAVLNTGPGNVAGGFSVAIYDNGVYLGSANTGQACNNMPADYYCSWQVTRVFGTVGNHTLQIMVDSTGAVPESNEADNVYVKTIYVSP